MCMAYNSYQSLLKMAVKQCARFRNSHVVELLDSEQSAATVAVTRGDHCASASPFPE